MASDSTLKQLEQILAKRERYVVKADQSKRDLDAINGTVADLGIVLATLINDLKKQGILK
jgi:hypothetical protein